MPIKHSVRFLPIVLLFLLPNFSSAATEFVSVIRQSCTGYANCYTSLSAWEAARQGDLVAANTIETARIEGDWTVPDTTAVTIDGWTTGPNNYINIYTDTTTTPSARHDGKWNTSKYRLEVTAAADYVRGILIREDHVRIDGLQIHHINNDWAFGNAILVDSNSYITAGSGIYISNNIIKSTGTTSANDTSNGIYTSATNGTYYIWNNIVYDFNLTGTQKSYGILAYGTNYIYNNTVANSAYCIRGVTGTFFAKNNIVQNCSTDGFLGTFDASSNYNLSSIAADAPGANSKNSTTVSFVDSTNKDFHLLSSDTSAKDSGTDLSFDTNLPFTTDIDGATRAGSWDIGADESTTVSSDTTAPSTPTGLSATTISSSQINLSWTASTDDTAVVGYKIYRDGTQVNTSVTTSYSDTGLTGSTTYTYTVSAYDAAPNNSTQSSSAQATTQAGADTTPPVRSAGSPSGALASSTTSTTLSLTTNENATCKYSTTATTAYASMTGTFSTTGATTHSATISGLTNGSSYNYYIRCQDAVGNANTDDYGISFSVAVAGSYAITVHPRSFLTNQKITQLQQKASSSATEYTQWKNWIDAGNGSVKDLALIYKITGSTTYRDRAITAGNYLVNTDPNRNNSVDCSTAYLWDFMDQQVSYSPNRIQTVALAYDWLYDDLSPSDKIAWRNFIIARADCIVTYYGTNGYSPYANYFFQALYALAQAGVAVYGDDIKAETYLNTAKSMYQNQFVPLAADVAGGAYFGGGLAEGTGYGVAIDMYRIVQYAILMKSAIGEDYMSLAGSYYTDMPRYLMHAIYPVETYKSRIFSSGDYSENSYYSGRSPYGIGGAENIGAVREFLLMLAENISDATLSANIRSFLADTQYGLTVPYQDYYMVDVLWHNSSASASPISSLFYFAKGIGEVFMRAGWNLGDTWIGYKSGDHFSYHQHVDQGSFQIMKRGQLAIKSGNYYCAPREDCMLNYGIRTVASNSVLVYNPAETFTRVRANDTYNNDGGQKGSDAATPEPFDLSAWTSSGSYYNTADITKAENGSNYSLVVSDNKNAYSSSKLSKFDRYLLYLRPGTDTDDYVVIFDRVNSANSGFRKKWLLHSLNYPTITRSDSGLISSTPSLFWDSAKQVSGHIESTDGDIVQFDDLTGRLFSKTLLPSSHTITRVGGTGYEHYADGANHYTSSGSKVLWGEWRVEIEPTTAQADDSFLHVLYPTTTATSAMPNTTLIVSSDLAVKGALIEDSTNPRIALFSVDGTSKTSVTYDAVYSTSLTGRHILADLQPGNYDIYKNGVRILSSISASSDGTLYFESQGGSSFAVVQAGTITADTTAPTISAISSSVTTSSATITFTTDESSDTQIEYGLTTSYGLTTTLNTTLTTAHSQTISSLPANATYNYRIITKDASGNTATSQNYTFTTQSVPDTQGPSAITTLATSDLGQTSLSLSWTAPSDTSGVATYDIRYSTSPIDESNFSSATQVSQTLIPATSGTTQSQYVSVGLTPGTTYYFAIKSTDTVGNVSSVSNIPTGTTISAPTTTSTTPSTQPGTVSVSSGGGGYIVYQLSDSQAPSTPSSFKASALDGQVSLSWVNPTDADFVRVKIVRKTDSAVTAHTDGTTIYDGTDTIFTDTNLTNGQTYYYAIYAYDKVPNYSATLNLSATPKASLTQTNVSSTVSTSRPSYTFSNVRAITYGMKNNTDVRELQKILQYEGLLSTSLSADGSFGPKTKASVIAFQKKYAISPAQGYVGSLTKAKLNQLYGSTTVTTTTTTSTTTLSRNLTLGSKGDDVKKLQQILNADPETQIASSGAGSPGNETTYFGAATKAAVIKYQKKHGITPAQGYVGAKTRGEMGR